MKILRFITVFFVLIYALSAKDSTRIPPNQYLYSGMSLGYQHIKDTGTSPLRYHGIYSNAEFAYRSIGSKSAFRIQGDVSYAAAFAANYYNLNYLIGKLQVLYLHSMPFIKHKDLSLRLGGSFDASVSAAINPDFQNATLNVDYLFDLMLNGQLEYDFILKEKSGKFLLFTYQRPEHHYKAFFRLDIPFLILNGRPEFAYLNPEDMDYFSRNYYFGGYKMGTELGIKRFLPNGNIIEIKYEWDMYSSGNKDIHLLERASHNLAIAFYFKLN